MHVAENSSHHCSATISDDGVGTDETHLILHLLVFRGVIAGKPMVLHLRIRYCAFRRMLVARAQAIVALVDSHVPTIILILSKRFQL